MVPQQQSHQSQDNINFVLSIITKKKSTVSLLGRDKGYTVKYNPLAEGVPEGEAQGNS